VWQTPKQKVVRDYQQQTQLGTQHQALHRLGMKVVGHQAQQEATTRQQAQANVDLNVAVDTIEMVVVV
jgi:hypothetical protein